MYVNEKHGYTNVWEMLISLEDDFIAAGMTVTQSAKDQYYYVDQQGNPRNPTDPVVLIVQPSQYTDILYQENPWCIVFKAVPTSFRYDVQNYNSSNQYSGTNLGGSIFVYVTTPTQVLDASTGRVAFDNEFPGFKSGGLGSDYTYISNWKATTDRTGGPDSGYTGQGPSYKTIELPFIEWFMSIEAEGLGHTSSHTRYPYHPHPTASTGSYFVSVSNHGVFFQFWKEAKDHQGNASVWFCVQRPVNKDGNVLDIETKPLVCAYKYASQLRYKGDVDNDFETFMNTIRDPKSTTNQIGLAWEGVREIVGVSVDTDIYKFIVNEVDVKKPSKPEPATRDTTDSAAIINVAKQVSITESNKYVASFPGSLNTQRHIYTEELDMFCFISADVIAENVEIDLEQFGGIKRYRALPASEEFNRGVRMMALSLEQFEDGFDNTVVSQLGEGNTLMGGGNDPENNPWGRPPRSQAELGITYENTNIATFDPDAIS